MAEATTTVLKAGTPLWVDLATPDLKKAGEFYAAVLGWQLRELGPDAGGYVMFDRDGKEVAGGGPLQSEGQPPAWTTYIKVEDAAATAKAAVAAGGTILVEPMAVMEQGSMAIIQDPTGAVIAIWQSGAHDGAQLYNAPGALCWNELGTRDVPAAKAFYAKVFGVEAKTEGEGTDQEYTQLYVDGRGVAGVMDISKMLPAEIPAYWLSYFGVSDLANAIAQTNKLGGQVRMGPIPSPFGPFAVIADPSGAVFAAIELSQS